MLWRQRRKLHVEVCADGERDGRGSEEELDQCCCAGDVASELTKRPLRIRKRTTGVRDRRSEFGETEDKGRVHGGDEDVVARNPKVPALAHP